MREIAIANEHQTMAFGHAISQQLFPGAVLALVGPLGAGKTFLTRAIASGLGVEDLTQVTSPTFILHQLYEGRMRVNHFDVYRMKSPNEFIDLGFLEILEGVEVCLIEWADRVSHLLPPDHLRIELEPLDAQRRRVTLSASGPRHEQLMRDILASLPQLEE